MAASLMMHLVAIIADGAAHNTRYVWICQMAIGRARWSSTNQKRGLEAEEKVAPQAEQKLITLVFWQYLLNNWSIVENNSLYELLPWVVANGRRLL